MYVCIHAYRVLPLASPVLLPERFEIPTGMKSLNTFGARLSRDSPELCPYAVSCPFWTPDSVTPSAAAFAVIFQRTSTTYSVTAFPMTSGNRSEFPLWTSAVQ